ncbi:NAD(P)-dependent oxidoreductase [Roseibacterium sp. SDUM158017]|uniref:NAD(P)-dependent oxidoreductase n=1 Tax=Roseicyclus salinarum TaxID=3036773 RepID=UPI002415309B|nr:NAD(P)-dependent oxidoreductase [Roseibacterium sp. SDUM158017]MDG4648311.1 NAD(P)-dependent oxidoreductase [Roseibacterium sp. SDUM158017]
MERIGVVGLGRMGSAMALRFAAQGAQVTGWTRSGRTVEGVASAPDLGALVAASDALVLSLYDDAAVAEVLDALLGHDLPGKLILETSTVVPKILQDREAALAARGAELADAPVSGGPEMVEAGTCGVFLGAAPDTAGRAAALLRLLTPRVARVGPLGAGMVMKTINNSMLQAYVAGLREMLPLARRAGIPLADVLGILNAGPAGLPMIRDRMAKILGEDETVGFTLAGIAKDNDVFRRVVEAHGLTAPVLAQAGRIQRAAIESGLGESDPAAAIAAAYHDG